MHKSYGMTVILYKQTTLAFFSLLEKLGEVEYIRCSAFTYNTVKLGTPNPSFSLMHNLQKYINS